VAAAIHGTELIDFGNDFLAITYEHGRIAANDPKHASQVPVLTAS